MTEKIEVDLDEIRQITSWLAASGIRCAEIGRPGLTVRLNVDVGRHHDDEDDASSGIPVTPSATAAEANAGIVPRSSVRAVSVTASTVGVFLASHPARAKPLVAPGSRVEPGDTIGLLQIAHLCLPVAAPLGGVVTQPLVAHGATVGYGTPLFEISPAA
ncbi:acetyl-CoA carboxylase biotin carboxyl carrier protein [Trinickia dinghuensis]|nr:acetyl-CoA carboxylase biotin carboxyl carrier protein subunit [Trinickia dinghuensis]